MKLEVEGVPVGEVTGFRVDITVPAHGLTTVIPIDTTVYAATMSKVLFYGDDPKPASKPNRAQRRKRGRDGQ